MSQSIRRPWKKHLSTFYRHPVSAPEIFKDSSPVWTISLPSVSGALTLTRLETTKLEYVNLCPFIAELRVAGHETSPILMYFMTLQARRGESVDRWGLHDDCGDIPVAEILHDLCPAGFCEIEVIFELGGVLEFCYMVAPPNLNGLGLWKPAADSVIREIQRRQRPGILLLKALPMELTTVQARPAWAETRLNALKRLYASKLGVEDLGRDGWMWRHLREHRDFSLFAEYAGVQEEDEDFDPPEGYDPDQLILMTGAHLVSNQAGQRGYAATYIN